MHIATTTDYNMVTETAGINTKTEPISGNYRRMGPVCCEEFCLLSCRICICVVRALDKPFAAAFFIGEQPPVPRFELSIVPGTDIQGDDLAIDQLKINAVAERGLRVLGFRIGALRNLRNQLNNIAHPNDFCLLFWIPAADSTGARLHTQSAQNRQSQRQRDK